MILISSPLPSPQRGEGVKRFLPSVIPSPLKRERIKVRVISPYIPSPFLRERIKVRVISPYIPSPFLRERIKVRVEK